MEMKEEIIKDEIDEFFDEFISTKPIFKNKSVLEANYFPSKIFHRENYLKDIAKILAPVLRYEKPSNLFIYGKSGTGKSLCINHILNKIKSVSISKSVEIDVISINCKLRKVADTEYRILSEILNYYKIDVPATGISTNELYKKLYEIFDNSKKNIVLVLDEIDNLIHKVGDEILYNLVRINTELLNAKLTIVGITNDLTIMDNVDSRVKSSLGEEEIVFLPYNAIEIQDILNERSKEAFYENVLGENVIPKISAYCARVHGDARRAVELLRFSGEIAEREKKDLVQEEHVEIADKRLEKNRILEILKSQPKQYQLVMYSIIKTTITKKHNLILDKKSIEIEPTTTGAVFDYYSKLAKDLKIPSVSIRRISDIIVELEVLGIINFKIVSKGRYGRTRYINVGLPKSLYSESIKILKENLGV